MCDNIHGYVYNNSKKLWLLKPVKKYLEFDNDIPHDENPWLHWVNKGFGYVIRAETEDIARGVAHDYELNEYTRFDYAAVCITRHFKTWLNPKYSTCEELIPEGIQEICLIDFRKAD